jgi:hypothetical protein
MLAKNNKKNVLTFVWADGIILKTTHTRKSTMAMTREQFYQTPGGQILLQLRREIQEFIVVPNSWLPESFHNRRDGGRTLARLNAMCDIRDTPSPHQIEKAEKAKRIQAYREQLERGDSFTYDEDSRLLNEKIVTFCTRAVQAGMMELDPEDFE